MFFSPRLTLAGGLVCGLALCAALVCSSGARAAEKSDAQIRVLVEVEGSLGKPVAPPIYLNYGKSGDITASDKAIVVSVGLVGEEAFRLRWQFRSGSVFLMGGYPNRSAQGVELRLAHEIETHGLARHRRLFPDFTETNSFSAQDGASVVVDEKRGLLVVEDVLIQSAGYPSLPATGSLLPLDGSRVAIVQEKGFAIYARWLNPPR